MPETGRNFAKSKCFKGVCGNHSRLKFWTKIKTFNSRVFGFFYLKTLSLKMVERLLEAVPLVLKSLTAFGNQLFLHTCSNISHNLIENAVILANYKVTI